MFRRAAWLVLSVGLSACTSPTTLPQVLVEIDAEPAVRATTTHLEVSIYGGDGIGSGPMNLREMATYATEADAGVGNGFPRTVSLSPLDGDARRVYRVVVRALDATNGTVGTARLVSGYLPGKVLAFRLVLEDACRSVPCGDDQTCHDGTCVSAEKPATELARHCPAGQSDYLGTCVDPSACGSVARCSENATCGGTSGTFLCECSAGYAGDGVTSCTAVAVPVACPMLDIPVNGALDRTSGSAGDIATYSCLASFELSGNGDAATRTCQQDASWSGSAPACPSSGGYPTWPMPGTPNHARVYTTSAATVLDGITGLEWQRTVDALAYTYTAAVSYCDSLALDDKTDWRMPTRIELLSIVDFARSNPSIDPSAFPGTPSERFWTSTVRTAAPQFGRWSVGFQYGGDTYGYDESATQRVRCVR